jgi:hypothetical protein
VPEHERPRHVEFAFHRGEDEKALPRSVVMPPLESFGAQSLGTSEHGTERFQLAVDGTPIWIELRPKLTGISCLVPANGSPECIGAIRSIIGPWESASMRHLGGALEMAEDYPAPPEVYLRGSERRRDWEHMLVLREESLRLRWEVKEPVELEAHIAAADAILAGDVDAVTPLAGDPEASGFVSGECARRLFMRADAPREQRRTGDVLWSRAQDAVTELAQLDGAQSFHLAIALLEASLFEKFTGKHPDGGAMRKRMKPETAAWLSAAIPRRLAWEVDNRHLGGGAEAVSLQQALWNIPGAVGTRWVSRYTRNDARHDQLLREGLGTNFESDQWRFDDGQAQPWDQEDATDRLDAIAEAAPNGWWAGWACITFGPPPRYTAIAQGRIAAAHSTEAGPREFRERVAKNLAGYLSGELADDVVLFEWDAPPERRSTVRSLLELAAGTERRKELAAEALRVELISAADATFFSAPLGPSEQPGDKDAPWQVEPPSELGEIDAPDGLLTGGNPLGEPAWTITVPAGTHRARLVTATHPVNRQANAALEILFDPGAKVASWEFVPGGFNPEGFEVEFGIGMVAPPGVLEGEMFEEHGGDAAFEPLYGGFGGLILGTAAGLRVVAFAVGPQRGLCRSWIGRDADGVAVRLVIDFAVAGIDPAANGLPWD